MGDRAAFAEHNVTVECLASKFKDRRTTTDAVFDDVRFRSLATYFGETSDNRRRVACQILDFD